MAESRASTFVLEVFDKLFSIKRREFLRVQLFFLFLATSSIFAAMAETVGDTLFLSRFGGERAEGMLPWVYIGVGLLTMALTYVYEHVEERYSREKVLIGVYLFLAASLLLFRWSMRDDRLWVFYGLNIWIMASVLLAFMLFFSFAGDYFTGRDARRLYGYINGGIAVGSIVGGFAVEPLVKIMGDENLLYICSGLLALGALMCMIISNVVAPLSEEGEQGEREEGAKLPLKAVLTDRFLQIVMILVLASQILGSLVDFQLKVVASQTLKEEALAIFFGKFYSTLGIAQVVVQFGLVGWLLRRFGTVKSLMVLPALLVVTNGVFFSHPLFLVAAAGNFLRLAFMETLDEPATELLFMPLAPRLRVRAQSFVEGIVLPLGILLSGILLLSLGGVFHQVRQISIVGIAFGGIGLASALLLLPRYREMLATSLRQLGMDSMDLARALAGADGIKMMLELLRGGAPDQQALALDLWEGRALGELAEPVRDLVASANEVVAVRALRFLAADRSGENLPCIARAQADARAEVRAAAISAQFEIDPKAALLNFAKWLKDDAPPVQVAVLTGCLSHGGRLGSGVVLPRLQELLKSQAVLDRIVAAKVLGQAAERGAGELFSQALLDPAVEVRREIISARPKVELAPWLIKQLREPSLRALSSQALEDMPMAAVPVFIEHIAERGLPLEDRSLLIRIMGRFGGLRGAKVLWEVLSSNEDVMLRVAAAETLLYMKAENKRNDLSRYQEDAFIYRRLEEVALINRAREEAGSRDPFFSQMLFDHARLEVKAALFATALYHEDQQIQRVEATLFSGTQGQRSNALEIIEVIFPHDKASQIVALISSLAEEHASGAKEGLAPETIRRLLRSQPWLRVAARHYIDRQQVKFEEGGKMTGNEVHMYKLMAHISFLKNVKIFEGVSANYLMSLAKIMQERSFVKGEVLFAEGGKGDCAYLVCEGAIRVTMGGKEVSRLGANECVGETALIDNLPRSATATADSDLRVLRISSGEFNDVLLTHPEITVALLRYLNARLREAMARTLAQA